MDINTGLPNDDHDEDKLDGVDGVGEDLGYVNIEPVDGMEFESCEQAKAYYEEYARSLGFSTAIQYSRRSKSSNKFIDAKFACTRYGTKRSKQDTEHSVGRKGSSKTDCKASMHVKQKADGIWFVHKFEKEHNHELLPPQAVNEKTMMTFAALAKHFAEYKRVGIKSDQNFAILLEFFSNMQSINSGFFYALDISADQGLLKNFVWVDAKSRHDYASFSDVVSFDTTYVRNKFKLPIALFIGVNHHYQCMLLGTALISDESSSTLSWVMRTWLKAMGGQAPKVIITDHEEVMKSVISENFPSSLHYFCLWHVLEKVSGSLKNVVNQNEEFMVRFKECISRPWTEEDFGGRWQDLLGTFGVEENEMLWSLYGDREKWVPALIRNVFLGGMSTAVRSDSVNSFFDKYVQKKTTLQEFVKQYEAILEDRYEEEAKADFETWKKQPAVKSSSPFEKHMAGVYTHTVFEKFQNEVVGAGSCFPKLHKLEEKAIAFTVQDFGKDMEKEFMVTWNEVESRVSCTCRLFELKGYLCRHAVVVLEARDISTIPQLYVMKRWMKDAKSRYPLPAGLSGENQSRLQRYNDLCQRALLLSEEGSLSQERYTFALRALDEAYGNCVNVNNTSNQKKRKVVSEQDAMTGGTPENFAQLGKLTPRPVALDGYRPQQGQFPMRVSQQTIQDLGQFNSVAPTQDQETMQEQD